MFDSCLFIALTSDFVGQTGILMVVFFLGGGRSDMLLVAALLLTLSPDSSHRETLWVVEKFVLRFEWWN